MRIANYIMMAMFLLFAVLQYNDEDPYIWVPVYLFAAAVCWLDIAGKRTVLAPISAVGFLAIAAIWWPGADKVNWGEGGPGWETGGLLIAGLWCAVLTWRWRRQKAATETPVSEQGT
jgi:hypothetical protein